MRRDRLRLHLDRAAREAALSVALFADAVAERDASIADRLLLAYRLAGAPYGEADDAGDDAPLRWYAEQAVAYHLERTAARRRGEHAALSEARAILTAAP